MRFSWVKLRTAVAESMRRGGEWGRPQRLGSFHSFGGYHSEGGADLPHSFSFPQATPIGVPTANPRLEGLGLHPGHVPQAKAETKAKLD